MFFIASSDVPLKAHMKIINKRECRSRLQKVCCASIYVKERLSFQEFLIDEFDENLHLCALGLGRPCTGDSGAGLIVEQHGVHYVIGVVSGGAIDCDGEVPGYYASVKTYVRWIDSFIRLEETNHLH